MYQGAVTKEERIDVPELARSNGGKAVWSGGIHTTRSHERGELELQCQVVCDRPGGLYTHWARRLQCSNCSSVDWLIDARCKLLSLAAALARHGNAAWQHARLRCSPGPLPVPAQWPWVWPACTVAAACSRPAAGAGPPRGDDEMRPDREARSRSS